MAQLISEAAGSVKRTGPGRILLTLITPGEGSSGTYTAEVLAKAAEEKAFPRGTQSHVNHDTEAQRQERPEGDLRNLAMVLLEDAYVGEGGSLVAEARVGSHWRDFVEDFQEFLGASIVANAEVLDTTEGRVIERLLPGPFNRIDLVTNAGRGGRIEEVLESARVIGGRSRVNEATANETQQALYKSLRETYGADETWIWVRDNDETTVWFDVEGADTTSTFQQTFSMEGLVAALSGERVEVKATTTYVALAPTEEASTDSPVIPAGVTENKKEDATMATVQIEEAELTTLRESASRVTVLEAEAATRTAKEAEDAASAHTAALTAAVAESFTEGNAPRVQAALVAEALAKESTIEQAKEAAIEAAAELASESGAGKPSGIGKTAAVAEAAAEPTDADVLSALKGA